MTKMFCMKPARPSLMVFSLSEITEVGFFLKTALLIDYTILPRRKWWTDYSDSFVLFFDLLTWIQMGVFGFFLGSALHTVTNSTVHTGAASTCWCCQTVCWHEERLRGLIFCCLLFARQTQQTGRKIMIRLEHDKWFQQSETILQMRNLSGMSVFLQGKTSFTV